VTKQQIHDELTSLRSRLTGKFDHLPRGLSIRGGPEAMEFLEQRQIKTRIRHLETELKRMEERNANAQ
jgi:50S ribosomal subunit-associated GTPase HflX